ncbi:transcriptional regulator with XRE-family HTH domain [Mesorhizobium jarvisii]
MMKGAKSWVEIRSELDPDIQKELDERIARRRLGEALAEIRKERKMTQKNVSVGAAMTQNNISRMEHGEDMLLSSIVRYMQALGGGLELVLKLPDGSARHVAVEPKRQQSEQVREPARAAAHR